MTEKIRALCIEGYCVNAEGFSDAQREQLAKLDRNGDGIVSAYLAAPPDQQYAWAVAPDDPELVLPREQVPVDVTPGTPASANAVREFLRHRLFVDPDGGQRFHFFHMPQGRGSPWQASSQVIGQLPQALADLRRLGMFPADAAGDIAVILRNDTSAMRRQSQPAFGGKYGSPFGMPILGLTYEYVAVAHFLRMLKHELTHASVHLTDPFAPRWLQEAIASHAENYEPGLSPLERLALPERLRGQWATKFRALKWERIDQVGEFERYQICHAFFLFIEDQYSIAAIRRFHEILRTSGETAERALLLATGEASIDRLQQKCQQWLARHIARRDREDARRRWNDRRICRNCRSKPVKATHAAAPLELGARIFARVP